MYLILDKDKHHLIPDQVFSINILKPSSIKVVADDINEYISEGGYKRILAIIPVNHHNRTTSINRTVDEFFKTNQDCVTDLPARLICENY